MCILVADCGLKETSVINARKLAKSNNANPCFIFSCGHLVLGDDRHKNPIGIRIRRICDKCRNHDNARITARKRLGLFVGSDRKEFAYDKKKYEAAKE